MSDTSITQTIKTLKPSDITTDMLIVDIRPQVDYDRSHYNGSISLFFPQVLFRRLIRKKNDPSVLDDFLLGDMQILKNRHTGTFIVLYDESTTDINTLSPSEPLRIFSEIFLTEGTNFAFVEGGFQAIKATFPDMLVVSHFSAFCSPIQTQKIDSPKELPSYALPLSFFLGDFMAIGSEENARDITLLNAHKITHILNVTTTETLETVKIGREILQIPIYDSISQDILQYFPQAIKFIHAARAIPNAKLLIHCQAGISRSVSFAIAYVMWAEHKSLDDAFALIHKHRPCASPNLNFMGQLMVFGNFLQIKSSNTEEIYSPTYIISQAIDYLNTQNI